MLSRSPPKLAEGVGFRIVSGFAACQNDRMKLLIVEDDHLPQCPSPQPVDATPSTRCSTAKKACSTPPDVYDLVTKT